VPVARVSFWVGRRLVQAGETVDRSDPIVAGRASLFVVEVEQASAVPGELRAVGVPRHACGSCGKGAKSAAGLSAHMRSHA
jgi:hypothetical protein